MKKRRILAAVLSVMMMVTMLPGVAFAAEKTPSGEEYVEYLELYYKEYVKDRSQYCDEVWAEIQEVYMEGRQYCMELSDADYIYIDETSDAYFAYNIAEIDYFTLLEKMGKLTRTSIKSKNDLPKLKKQYLAEIDEAYKECKKADYNDYNWDMIQDCLYMGKKQLNAATTFREAVSGRYYAMAGMEFAADKEVLEEYKVMAIEELSRYVNLYLDQADYTNAVWTKIQNKYKEAVTALNKAELEQKIIKLTEKYGEAIAELAGTTYPISDDDYEELVLELMESVIDYYEDMELDSYSYERQDEADMLVWDLEMMIYDVQSRAEANKLVQDVLKKLQALPTRAEDQKMVKNYNPKVKAEAASTTAIKISWTANKNMDYYVVYRADKKNGSYEQIQLVDGSRNSVKDKKLEYGKTYYYKVQGIKSIDYSEKSTKMSKAAKGSTKVTAPVVNLSKAGKSAVLLKWKAVGSAKGYEIYRSTSAKGTFKKVATINKGKKAKWKDTSTKKGKTYYYKVRCYTKVDGKKIYSSYSKVKKIKR